MRELFLAFSIGWAAGGFMLWGWFRSQRLIRTREEWYADPIIAAKHPEDAARALGEVDDV